MNKNLIQQLKALQHDQTEYSFTKADFPDFSGKETFDQLVIYDGGHRNVSFCLDDQLPVEVIHNNPRAEFLGYKESFLQLGINLVGMVLHQKKVLEISLTHPKSKISKLFMYAEEQIPIQSNFVKYSYQLDIEKFNFFPQEVSRIPFASYSKRAILDEHRPGFHYAWADQEENHKQTTPPDYVVIQAPVEGLLALAELFMDFGRNENKVDEINLETSLYGGMEGSRLGSIETRFWLPGSFLFPEDHLDDIYVF